MKTFAGKKVIHERNDIDRFELAVNMKEFKACAKAYLDAHDKTTFVAIEEAWGVNYHIPEGYRREPLRFKTNISTLVEAKKIATGWLRDACKRDNAES